MSSVRLRRLASDYDKVKSYVTAHPRLQLIQAHGDPPEKYHIEFRIKSLKQKDGEIVYSKSHQVEIHLPLSYPRLPPQCRMLTPVFHPNIAPHAICIGDHWSSGEPLDSIIARIGEMLAYQSYNTKSPLNGEAAKWVNENLDNLPIDKVIMILERDESQTPSPPAAPTPILTPNSNLITPPASTISRPHAAPPPLPGQKPPVSVQPTPSAPAAPALSQPPPAPTPVSNPEPAPAASPPATTDNDRITLVCPNCSAKLKVAASLAGKRARCPRCTTIVTIPEP